MVLALLVFSKLALRDDKSPLGMLPPAADLHYTARLAAALSYEMALGPQSSLKEYVAALPSGMRVKE